MMLNIFSYRNLMQNDASSETMVFIFQVNEIYDLRKVTHIPNRNKYTTSIGAYALF